MNTAWMIRNDGKVFPCVQHIYANPEDVGKVLLAAQWLYDHTRHKECRQLALETIAAWMASIVVGSDGISYMPDSLLQMSDCPLSQKFVMAHAEEIKAITTVKLHLDALCSEVVTELNQEFSRVQYGGVQHTDVSSKEIFFCIFSAGFDWYNIIHDFVAAADFPIEFIIIVRDEKITGKENDFYLRLPTEIFLTEQPVQLALPSKLKGGVMVREIFAHLSYGSSLRHICCDLEISTSELANVLQIFYVGNNSTG